jgi:hypothetical protein
MAPALTTVTVAALLGMLGVLVLAVRVAGPTLTPVIGTMAVVPFCGMVTLAGTLTIPDGVAARLTVTGAGAAADSVNVTFWVAVPVTDGAAGVKLRVAPTLTSWLPVLKPVAEAVIAADPKLTPVIVG